MEKATRCVLVLICMDEWPSEMCDQIDLTQVEGSMGVSYHDILDGLDTHL
jgi:hypothetical protein